MRFMRPVRAHNSQRRIRIKFGRPAVTGLIMIVFLATLIFYVGQPFRSVLGMRAAKTPTPEEINSAGSLRIGHWLDSHWPVARWSIDRLPINRLLDAARSFISPGKAPSQANTDASPAGIAQAITVTDVSGGTGAAGGGQLRDAIT